MQCHLEGRALFFSHWSWCKSATVTLTSEVPELRTKYLRLCLVISRALVPNCKVKQRMDEWTDRWTNEERPHLPTASQVPLKAQGWILVQCSLSQTAENLKHLQGYTKSKVDRSSRITSPKIFILQSIKLKPVEDWLPIIFKNWVRSETQVSWLPVQCSLYQGVIL